MPPQLQSLVKYDNAVLVSSTKEKKVKDKLSKVSSVLQLGKCMTSSAQTVETCACLSVVKPPWRAQVGSTTDRGHS